MCVADVIAICKDLRQRCGEHEDSLKCYKRRRHTLTLLHILFYYVGEVGRHSFLPMSPVSSDMKYWCDETCLHSRGSRNITSVMEISTRGK